MLTPRTNNFYTSPSIFGLEVSASVPGTFASDALPIQPPPLAALLPFEPLPNDSPFGYGTSFVVIGDGSVTDEQIRGAIETWVRVPEPPAMFLAALAGLSALLCASSATARLRRARASAAPTSSSRRGAAWWQERAARGPA